MIRYFDTSALVKRYVAEPGSAEVGRLLETDDRATCRLAELEIGSAIARRRRAGEIAPGAARELEEDLARDLDEFHVVELDRALVEEALRLVGRHPLRAADALHLAAALRLDGLAGVEFVCFDPRLAAAAAAEGMPVTGGRRTPEPGTFVAAR